MRLNSLDAEIIIGERSDGKRERERNHKDELITFSGEVDDEG
jgi:hypothetical protein